MDFEETISDVLYLVPLFIVMVILMVLLVLVPIASFGSVDGQHSGYVTAVEHNSNLIWDADIVYFKTDATSSQEDKYCVNDMNLKEQLLQFSKESKEVTIYYQNNFIMWRRQCNGGESIIYGVKT